MEHALGTVIPSGMGNLQYVPALVGMCLRHSRWQCPVLKMEDGGLLPIFSMCQPWSACALDRVDGSVQS